MVNVPVYCKSLLFDLSIPVRPMAKARPRFSCGRVFTPQKNKDYEERIGEEARRIMGDRPPLSGPLFLMCSFRFKTPKQGAKKRGFWKMGRPDLDNLTKAAMDALNGIVYKDDSQIVAFYVGKSNAEEDEILIEIWDIS